LRNTNRLTIGRGTYGKPKIYFWKDETKLQIGNFCSIAADVKFILGGEHRHEWISTFPFMEFPDNWSNSKGLTGHPGSKGDIVVGNDVWIGNGCTILSGVTIGNGAVLAAGSLVSKSIPEYAIAGGVPAKVIKKRFSSEVIKELEALQWWNWADEKINENLRKLLAEPTKSSIRELRSIQK
jgi:acetyltransferase-like isoleucine patch superfamily enzyme